MNNQELEERRHAARGRGGRLAAILAAATIAVGGLVGVSAPAQAAESPSAIAGTAPSIAPLAGPITTVSDPVVTPDNTGEYEYICQMPDGNSWSLQVGEPTTDCHGSYLQKYINGSMVANYKLVYDGGGYYSDVPPFPYGCAIAIAGAYLLVLYPPTSGVAWVLQGSVAAGGLATSCVA